MIVVVDAIWRVSEVEQAERARWQFLQWNENGENVPRKHSYLI